ncbi:MAG TPA: FHA domain-containing protein [Desulfobacteria bacterium]|nr:FHA domain-containing protein [Desulfobacteria bacterium]
MQYLYVGGRLAFVLLLYFFLFRVVTTLYGELRTAAWYREKRNSPFVGRLEVLTTEGGLTKGQVFKVGRTGLSVGRGINNDVVLPDSFASLEHARFLFKDGEIWLEDLNSTNGSWVNGERISAPIQLVPGDYVKIGSITFQYSRWQDED